MCEAAAGRVAGEFRIDYEWQIPLYLDGDILRESPWYPNTIVNSGYDLLGRLVAGQAVFPNYVYLEFANNWPAPPISVPSVNLADTVATYYAALAGQRDYLRLPLEISPFMDASGSGYASNRVTFYSVSNGTLGSRPQAPLTFSHDAGSVVYGMAIVYAPDPADKTKDILFSRGYPDTDLQKAKPESGQVTMMWRVKFVAP